MKELKAILEKAISNKSAKETVDFLWKLFDIENRDALQRDVQQLAVEPDRKYKKTDN